MATEPDRASEPGDLVEMESAVDQAIGACNGNLRATVRALLVMLDSTELELEALKTEVSRIEAAVSGGYVRRNLTRCEPGEA